VLGGIAIALLKALRHGNPDKVAAMLGWLMRTVGPLLPEQRTARNNLIAAFPEKPRAEIETILAGTWDNLGRMAAEFANLDRIWEFVGDERNGRLIITPENIAGFKRLADDGKPALIFAAHLANWELPAIAAAESGIDSTVLYRRPNMPGIDRWLHRTRSAKMGTLIPTDFDAPSRLASAIERGSHVGMLVDQYYGRGELVTFFGRRTRANPLLARLARHFDCPIHGVRIVRLPGNRFRGELSEEIVPARDGEGKVDVAATTQIIMSVVEGWVREHPEQWLWQHRRWRAQDDKFNAPSSPSSTAG
jgi:KDO2-lipid IV(A) lauroyltransferase